MKSIWQSVTTLHLVLMLAACAFPQPVQIGDTQAQVIAARGAPSNRYILGKEQLLEYRHGPFGQETFMARIGADGRLVSFEQVLTNQKFAAIRVGQTSKQDVLHLIGAPSEQSYLSLSRLEVWSYPYQENGIWDSIMHVHFDHSGIVRKMVNLPDRPRHGWGNLFGSAPW